MAIAYDSSAQSNTGAASSLTFSHTCTGSERLLIVDAYWGDSRTVSSVTYNSVSMTQVVAPLDTGGGERHGMYYLIAPATGANNVVITLSGSTGIVGISSSYTGVDQTTPTDANRTETGLETGTTYAEALTTVTDNSWVVWGTREYAGRTITAGANTALRQREASVYGMIVADSNAAVTPAGSRTLNLNANLSGNWYSDILMSLKPSAPAYSMVAALGTFTLTGISANLLYGRKFVADLGTFTLTGIAANLAKGFGIVGELGSYVLTGMNAALRTNNIWTSRARNSSTFSNRSRNSSTFSNRSKNSSSWTSRPKS